MQAGVTDDVWTLEEFLDTLLTEPAGEKPAKKPLRHRAPEARELPNGRGFLRVISGGKAPAPAPTPEAPTPAQRPCLRRPKPPPMSTILNSTSWTGGLALRSRCPTGDPAIQLSLFGDPPEGLG